MSTKKLVWIAVSIIILFLIFANDAKHNLARQQIRPRPNRWKIIAGYSDEHPDMMAIAITPIPGTNNIVIYFPTNAVFVTEIDDSGKEFNFRYTISTNTPIN